eukprot:321062-Chlamydomonas_euryale.AAC.2
MHGGKRDHVHGHLCMAMHARVHTCRGSSAAVSTATCAWPCMRKRTHAGGGEFDRGHGMRRMQVCGEGQGIEGDAVTPLACAFLSNAQRQSEGTGSDASGTGRQTTEPFCGMAGCAHAQYSAAHG